VFGNKTLGGFCVVTESTCIGGKEIVARGMRACDMCEKTHPLVMERNIKRLANNSMTFGHDTEVEREDVYEAMWLQQQVSSLGRYPCFWRQLRFGKQE
jgi:hypothetical protein